MAVFQLEAGSNAELSLLTAAQEAAAVTGQLLPGAPAVLWLVLVPAGKEELHLLAEMHLLGEEEMNKDQIFQLLSNNTQRFGLKLTAVISLRLDFNVYSAFFLFFPIG